MNEPRNLDLLPEILPQDPLHWADAWIKEAAAAQVQRNPNAMTLVTVGPEGNPSARMVLLKEFVPDPGYLVFYTNYQSRKAAEIAASSRVAALFHWDAVGRQIRIEGVALRSPDSESDEYFATRDWGSQLGAWGSDQSAPIDSRQALLRQIRERARTLGLKIGPGGDSLLDENPPQINRPPHWGGFRLWINAIELWIEGPNRIHDRALWKRNLLRGTENGFSVTPWIGTRLQP
ncbi:MAG: pyridoxamine 5'-phosphate oxidase [Woeseiaceae bacterium]|nr:pyridoxamine 5'-phosphate oxidase [Woeseiaceae bacterium]